MRFSTDLLQVLPPTRSAKQKIKQKIDTEYKNLYGWAACASSFLDDVDCFTNTSQMYLKLMKLVG